MPSSSVVKTRQVTLRGVEPALAAALEAEAQRRGLSLNRCLLALLREVVGLTTSTRRMLARARYANLDHLAGTWSTAEADAFDRALRQQRQVDDKL